MTVINPIEKIDRDVKILKYGNNRFFDFGIDKHGNIINLKTGSILKKIYFFKWILCNLYSSW